MATELPVNAEDRLFDDEYVARSYAAHERPTELVITAERGRRRPGDPPASSRNCRKCGDRIDGVFITHWRSCDGTKRVRRAVLQAELKRAIQIDRQAQGLTIARELEIQVQPGPKVTKAEQSAMKRTLLIKRLARAAAGYGSTWVRIDRAAEVLGLYDNPELLIDAMDRLGIQCIQLDPTDSSSIAIPAVFLTPDQLSRLVPRSQESPRPAWARSRPGFGRRSNAVHPSAYPLLRFARRLIRRRRVFSGVYVIRCCTTGRYKIGKSIDIANRLRSHIATLLSKRLPGPLEVVRIISVQPHLVGVLELALHKLYAAWRMDSEEIFERDLWPRPETLRHVGDVTMLLQGGDR